MAEFQKELIMIISIHFVIISLYVSVIRIMWDMY